MMVIVDSDVWSEALRKHNSASEATIRLKELINDDKIVMIGPIRQEVLSGLKEDKRFNQIKELLSAFPNQTINDSIYELAASFFNLCRSKGIQGSHTDFLICACAVSWDVEIFSKDRDFYHYSKYIPIHLHEI